MKRKGLKLTKEQKLLCEFDRNGVWGYTYPVDPGTGKKRIFSPREAPLPPCLPRKMTREQEFRMETNRLIALQKLAAVERWKKETNFEEKQSPLYSRRGFF